MTAPPCVMCGTYGVGGGDLHVADLESSRVFLHEDQFFPGYVLLVLRRPWQIALAFVLAVSPRS